MPVPTVQRIAPGLARPLFGTAATQRIEQQAAAGLPTHSLMQRAGLAVARLARALAPHARTVWIACGPGNNGGDGLEAALHLHQRGLRVVVSWLGSPETAPPDALRSWQRARDAGVQFDDQPPQHMGASDLCIDALLGIGLMLNNARSAPTPGSPLLRLLAHLRASPAPVLAVDVPTGLQADTGQYAPGFAPLASPFPTPERHTLSLLTLKPGLFTGTGRDSAGAVWFDDLGVSPGDERPSAWLANPAPSPARCHASHKGSYGDVAVVGGEGLSARGMGMTGAALLAARAALHSGAGRVLVALLDDAGPALDGQQPELMFRHFSALPLAQLTVVCGCGGGEAVRTVLAQVLAQVPRLVLDADALNAIAADPALQTALQGRAQQGQVTVLTPHPLEAARLLGSTASHVQADRLAAAQALADQFGCVAVLKGSGSIVAAPGQVAHINPTGNARLASAGTGDVLAGMLGAHLAAGTDATQAAVAAVWAHGWAADQWPDSSAPLTASALARCG
ncbi:MAG: NAD(P)H-hydrate dehydratase [Burkholderiaceae bacterium]|nr:NAD(P)H-hydrate dehydratase [Burkholderiaceae bacterium]